MWIYPLQLVHSLVILTRNGCRHFFHAAGQTSFPLSSFSHCRSSSAPALCGQLPRSFLATQILTLDYAQNESEPRIHKQESLAYVANPRPAVSSRKRYVASLESTSSDSFVKQARGNQVL